MIETEQRVSSVRTISTGIIFMRFTIFITTASLALAPMTYGMEENKGSEKSNNPSGKSTVERAPGTNFFILPYPTSQELQQILKDANVERKSIENSVPFKTSWRGIPIKVDQIARKQDIAKPHKVRTIVCGTNEVRFYVSAEYSPFASALMIDSISPCYLEGKATTYEPDTLYQYTWPYGSPLPRLLCPVTKETLKLFNVVLPSLTTLAARKVNENNISTTKGEGKDKTSLISEDLKDFLDKNKKK